MTCIICGTRFWWMTRTDPAEPCDCGAELTHDAWQDNPDIDLAAMRAGWERMKAGGDPEPMEQP